MKEKKTRNRDHMAYESKEERKGVADLPKEEASTVPCPWFVEEVLKSKPCGEELKRVGNLSRLYDERYNLPVLSHLLQKNACYGGYLLVSIDSAEAPKVVEISLMTLEWQQCLTKQLPFFL